MIDDTNTENDRTCSIMCLEVLTAKDVKINTELLRTE